MLTTLTFPLSDSWLLKASLHMQPGGGLHSGLGTFLAFVASSSSLVRFEPGALPFALRLAVQIGVPIPCLPPYCVGGS